MYSFANIDTKILYLDLTARNDWSSLFRQRIILLLSFCSSIELYSNFAFEMNENIDFLKLNAASVGNDTGPYKLKHTTMEV
jgi:hypothetical protein